MIRIIADGAIKPARAGVPKGERPAVWFSRRSTWEPTATKLLFDSAAGDVRNATVAEMLAAGGTLARIEVSPDAARHSWRDHLKLGHIDLRWADELEKVALKQGADPNDWRVSYHPVTLEKIIGVESSIDGVNWQSVMRPCESKEGLLLDSEFISAARAAIEAAMDPVEA